jgi:hypothetical protein
MKLPRSLDSATALNAVAPVGMTEKPKKKGRRNPEKGLRPEGLSCSDGK